MQISIRLNSFSAFPICEAKRLWEAQVIISLSSQSILQVVLHSAGALLGSATPKAGQGAKFGRLVVPIHSRRFRSFRELGHPALVINRPQDFVSLMMFGGFGVVVEAVGLFFYPHLLEPVEMARDSSGLGYVGVRRMPVGKLNHAPSKKLRMKIIKRDRARCIICGRSPLEDVTIELHVHHIIPWGRGGLTETENLATLCHTCHGGLGPYDDSFVRERVTAAEEIDADYRAQLTRYQQANRSFLEDPG